ncbi:MAG: hypothetical protein LBT89_01080 [Planctomycetaceae bacterium]|jgi:Spy/CpxP family protein refolding chaperone|nr:hypothetical protein [Planctomycetaceae bacterium]
MKHLSHLAVLTAAFVFSLTLQCPAQDAAPPKASPKINKVNIKEERDNNNTHQKAVSKTVYRSYWNGTGTRMMIMQFLDYENVRKEWNVSDEQYKQIKNAQNQAKSRPEWVEMLAEMKKIPKADDPAFQNADKETKQKWAELPERLITFVIENPAREAEKLLTPEQRKKVQELQIAAMSVMPMVSPDMFKALDLSDEQKGKMENIKKGLESEYFRNVDEMVDVQYAFQDKVYDKIEKENGATIDAKDFNEKMRAASDSLELENGSEFKKIQEAFNKNRALVTRLKIQMFDVLTDEQWAKLQDLVDNPPDFIKEELAQMKKKLGDEQQSDVWKPGVNSWQPGDAIPEKYRQQRAAGKKFPQKEKDK